MEARQAHPVPVERTGEEIVRLLVPRRKLQADTYLPRSQSLPDQHGVMPRLLASDHLTIFEAPMALAILGMPRGLGSSREVMGVLLGV